jgi:hypothetical protein
MPIRPENKALYPKDWPAISRAVKERAGWKCEQCAAPHMQIIWRSVDMTTYMLEHGEVHDAETGEFMGLARGSEYPGGKVVKVVLTTAHLDHNPANCADENLKALCQLHHLRYDAKLHAENAGRTTRARKASGDLFA